MGCHGTGIFVISFLILIILSVTAAGCTGTLPHDLTKAELQDSFLAHANTIQSYRAEFVRTAGYSGGDGFSERILYHADYPASFRMQYLDSPKHSSGTFLSSNGTLTGYYDATTGKYDTSSGTMGLPEYDYQSIARQIVKDGSFTITGKETIAGHDCYVIETTADPWSDAYVHYVWSRIRASVDPETGLVWNISTYYPKDTVNIVTRYDTIEVNPKIPAHYFDFVPPAPVRPRCDPKYSGYTSPVPIDTSIPIGEPMPGIKYSLHESDAGRTITLQKGDTMEITLRWIPGLAFRWLMPVTGSGLELVNAGPFSDGGDFWNVTGYYRQRYRAISPGTSVFDGVFNLDGCDTENVPKFNLTVVVA